MIRDKNDVQINDQDLAPYPLLISILVSKAINITFMKITKVIGLLVLIWIGYLVYTWVFSVKEIKRVCNEIQPGQSKQGVIAIIEAGKYLRYFESSDTNTNKQHLIIFSSESHGRYTCSVEHDGNVVIKSEYRQD